VHLVAASLLRFCRAIRMPLLREPPPCTFHLDTRERNIEFEDDQRFRDSLRV